MFSLAAIFLVVVALLFAWSMGAHYTGAVMGMPFASHAIRMWPALGLMAVLTIVGATFASEGVQQTVGLQIVDPKSVTIVGAAVMVLSAAILTTIYTYYNIPSSTIQILRLLDRRNRPRGGRGNSLGHDSAPGRALGSGSDRGG